MNKWTDEELLGPPDAPRTEAPDQLLDALTPEEVASGVAFHERSCWYCRHGRKCETGRLYRALSATPAPERCPHCAAWHAIGHNDANTESQP